jgi:nucleoside-diphosphate-sugar epimerase
VVWSRSSAPPALASLATWQRIDLLERDTLRRALSDLRPSLVYHCAGAAHVFHSWQNTSEAFSSNVLATHYLLDGLRRANVRCRLLIPGSAMVYKPSPDPLSEDDPTGPGSPYGLSKLAQEQLGLRALKEDGIDVIVARAFNHTGPRQSPDFAAAGMARQVALVEAGALDSVKVGNVEAQRDLTDVRDTCACLSSAHGRGHPGHGLQRRDRHRASNSDRAGRPRIARPHEDPDPVGSGEDATQRYQLSRRRFLTSAQCDRMVSGDPVRSDARRPARLLASSGTAPSHS